MMKRKALVMTLLLSLAGAGGWADTSMLGTPGGLVVPHARVLPEGRLQTTVSAVWIDRNDETKDNEWYSVNFGLLGTAEVGLSHVAYSSRKARDIVVHGKWLALPEKDRLPAVAIGVTDITGEVVSDPSVYLVASKLLWSPRDEFTGEARHPLWGHLGIGSGIYGDSPFAGIEWGVARNTRLLVEWGKNLSYGRGDYLFHVGAQYQWRDRFTLSAGAMDMRYPAVSLTARLDDLFLQ
ncbi:MAG TPA: YjbH domain-containing protein [Armatimonadota bacterium]|jgi:hypothetical protein|nr:YjbH domain-containing protein [Armatimonadota bacterium]HOJ22293.1 YjbH domain-containing protein [Armatimonadota bacterium]HOM83076.1 YjbH domain-containing protein [Armatimonadota bacterium]HOQ27182.1 YjbH domain-containing protein [Armatimonadota bacterium]HPO73190.1 YjbH domain-containing protein [Armatimonadota bacterium]